MLNRHFLYFCLCSYVHKLIAHIILDSAHIRPKIHNLINNLFSFVLCFCFMGFIFGLKLKLICNKALLNDALVTYILKVLLTTCVVVLIWSFTQRYFVRPELDELLVIICLYLCGTIMAF